MSMSAHQKWSVIHHCQGNSFQSRNTMKSGSSDWYWPLRPALDEEDDEDEHRDLRKHRARPGLEQLVREAEDERGIHGARELADAAEHHHQERVDDVALAEIRADVAELRERAAGEAGDAGAEAEGPGVDPRGRHADARGHGAVW